MMKQITIGTRASTLAMIQTRSIIERLRQHWPTLEMHIEHIRTKGDVISDVPLTQIGGDGVFVTEIERALQERHIDLAVHSLKDLPTVQPPGLCLTIVGPREDVRDVLVSRSSSVPVRIGTCSLRRSAQLRLLYPSAEILPLRGNVDTRLRKLEAGDYDAIILAAAGLHRLGMRERLAWRLTYLPVDVMMPAPGQAALAMELRDEPEMRALVASLNDPITQATTGAERLFLRRLGAGCYLPVGAYAEIVDDALILRGLVISLDGQRQVRVRGSMPWPTSPEEAEQLGIALAQQALEQGAADIISDLETSEVRVDEDSQSEKDRRSRRGGWSEDEGWGSLHRPRDGFLSEQTTGQRENDPTSSLRGKRILVTRTPEQAGSFSDRLRALGAIPIEFPAIRIAPPPDGEVLDTALKRLYTTDATGNPWYTWLVFTSVNGVKACFTRLRGLGYEQFPGQVRVAAIGPATAAVLASYRVPVDLVPAAYVAEAVANAIIDDTRERGETLNGQRILLARAAQARNVLVVALEEAGASVDEVAAYTTLPAAHDDEQARFVLRMLRDRQLEMLTFTSSSTVRYFLSWLAQESIDLAAAYPELKIACIGPITSRTAREYGLHVHIEATTFTINGLVEAILQHEGNL